MLEDKDHTDEGKEVMGCARYLLAGMAGSFLGTAPAHAQEPACTGVLMELTGKQLTAAAITQIGGEAGRYLAEREKETLSGTITLNRRDIRELERHARTDGRSACELRREIHAASLGTQRQQDEPPSSYPAPATQSLPDAPYAASRGTPPASACSTRAGYCSLVEQLPVGASCSCSSSLGTVYGFAQ